MQDIDDGTTLNVRNLNINYPHKNDQKKHHAGVLSKMIVDLIRSEKSKNKFQTKDLEKELAFRMTEYTKLKLQKNSELK